MGLFKRKNSECWHMCFFLEGRKVRKSTGTSNKRAALKIYDTARFRVAQGIYDEKLRRDMPFSELVDQFLDKHSRVEKASYKRDKVIGTALKAYFEKTAIGSVTPFDIKEWREWRMKHVTRMGTPITKAALNRELAFMRTMFNMAVEWGWLKSNPSQSVKLLRGETKRLRILNREELTGLIDAAADYLKPIIIAAVSTGMRKSEILSLVWKDVDFVYGFIRVEHSKNGEARNVPMGDFLKEILLPLKRGKASNDAVFTREGKRITCFKKAFKMARERAGISDFRFHDLRHTAAAYMAAGGCDIITLQHIMGHKSLSMTQRYTHLIPERFEKSRQIMQDFWQGGGTPLGDTKVTQLVDEDVQGAVIH